MLSVESFDRGSFGGGFTLLVTSAHRDARKGVQVQVNASIGGKEYHKHLDPEELIKLRLSMGIEFNKYETTVAARRKSASEFATEGLLPALATWGQHTLGMDNGQCVVTFNIPVQHYGQLKGRLILQPSPADAVPLCVVMSREADRLKYSNKELNKKVQEMEVQLEVLKVDRWGLHMMLALKLSTLSASASTSAGESAVVVGAKRRLIDDSGGTPMTQSSAKKAKDE